MPACPDHPCVLFSSRLAPFTNSSPRQVSSTLKMFRPLVLALLYGSATVYGAACPTGQTEMSVEGVAGIFCVSSSRICIATVSDGACPGAQTGLPFGSSCGVVKSGVYGCKVNSPSPATTPPPTPSSSTTTPPVATTAAPATGSKCTGGFEMSVEGVPGIFCVSSGPICIANRSDGTCPGAQAGLPLGSSCGVVKSGVYGCKANVSGSGPATTAPVATPSTATPGTTAPAVKPSTAPATGTKCPGGYEMSVEGVPGIFCVSTGPICMANNASGTCPGVQTGLPNGSSCGVVKSGVFGCKPNTEPVLSPQSVSEVPGSTPTPTTTTKAPTQAATPTPTNGAQCGKTDYVISVEGVPGALCLAKGPICAGQLSTGACPPAQNGLPNGSFCGVVKSGVYGCKPSAASTPAASTPATTTTPPVVPSASPTSTPSSSPAPSSTPPVPSPTDGSQCAKNEFPMSVEGVRGVFCLSSGPICMGQVSSGTCPGPQNGLPFGASCGIVKSGVYGCKPNSEAPTQAPTQAPVTETPPPSPSATTASPLTMVPGGSCQTGYTPMSIEGVVPIFCVPEPACVQNRMTGNCPGPQPGLTYGSYCDRIEKTGVYGCKEYGTFMGVTDDEDLTRSRHALRH